MDLLKQYGAIGILAVMMLGVINFMGRQVFDNANAVILIKERSKSNRQLLKEIRDDVKDLKERLMDEHYKKN